MCIRMEVEVRDEDECVVCWQAKTCAPAPCCRQPFCAECVVACAHLSRCAYCSQKKPWDKAHFLNEVYFWASIILVVFILPIVLPIGVKAILPVVSCAAGCLSGSMMCDAMHAVTPESVREVAAGWMAELHFFYENTKEFHHLFTALNEDFARLSKYVAQLAKDLEALENDVHGRISFDVSGIPISKRLSVDFTMILEEKNQDRDQNQNRKNNHGGRGG